MLYGMSQSNYFKNISSSMYPILARVKEPVVSIHCENKTNHLSYFFPSIDLVTDHHGFIESHNFRVLIYPVARPRN